MAYTQRGGIFAGIDDTRGVYALSGLDDTDPVLRGLGAVPPGTSGSDKASVRKSYYYLYTVATLAPKLRALGAIATGAAISAVVTNVLGLAAAGGASLAAMGVINSAEETTLWGKRSKKDRDNYIKTALIEGETRSLLQKAAKRMDAVATARTSHGRNMQRARAYFQDFIAVGPQASLKNLNPDQQAAFGAAYLDALGARKKEADALAAGNKAAGKKAEALAKAAKAAQMKQIKEKVAEARRQKQAKLAASKAQAFSIAKRKLAVVEKQKALLARLPPALRPAGVPVSNQATQFFLNLPPKSQIPPQLQQEVAAIQAEAALVQAEEVKVDTEIKTAEVAVVEATKDEVKIDAEVKAAEADVEAAAPTEAEKTEAAAADSTEDKEADKVAEKVADKVAPTSAEQAAVAPKGGLPIVPILAVAGIVGFLLLRKK
jgi:hypothetical protein